MANEPKYFTEPTPNEYVPATEEQMKEALKERFRRSLIGDEQYTDCPHTIFADEDAGIYVWRRCYVCEKVFEAI